MTTKKIRSGVRFSPPRVEVSAEVDWLLARGFRGAEASAGVEGAGTRFGVGSVGQGFGLLGRIRVRSPRQRLEAEADPMLLALMDEVARGATALMMVHQEVARQMAAVGEEIGVSLIFLKGLALHLLKITQPGARMTGDIDVLVRSDEAEKFHAALLESGCTYPGLRPPDYHLPLLFHPQGSAIEVHRELAGVRLGEGSYATGEECLAAGLWAGAPGLPANCLVPSEPLLVAHLLAHALGTHGKQPEMYPALQLLGDLQDLGYSATGGKSLPGEIWEWIERDVSREEVEATIAVLDRLEAGERASEIVQGEDDAGVLLRHLLAGYLDEDYVRSLKLARRLEAPEGLGPVSGIARNIWRTIWLPREQIDILVGRKQSALGYLGWRLRRPFVMVGKSLKAARAWVEVKRRAGSR